MQTIFLARVNSDLDEGNGDMVPKAAFTKENDADTFVNGQSGIWGYKSDVGWKHEPIRKDWDVVPMLVFESLDDKKEWDSGEVKRRALAKLDPAERAALGLADTGIQQKRAEWDNALCSH